MNKKSYPELTVKEGVVQVPEGYRWCGSCEALTVHEKDDWHSFDCIVCGVCNYPDNGCPNCGASDPLEDDPGGVEEVTLHHKGCHCNDIDRFVVDGDEDWWINRCLSEARRVAYEFKRDWMKPAPDRVSYMLPRDREWYDKHSKLKRVWEEAYLVKCGCPRTTIFRNINVYNYNSYPVYSMDCMNAIEWDYTVRCSVCGYIYEVHDGNC